MLVHLTQCRDCERTREQMLRLRAALKALPQRTPPERLAAQLRVIASRERARQAIHSSVAAWLADLAGRARLWLDNLMRPVALPFAGGLVSAIVLFSMLAPSVLYPRSQAKDVPIVGLYNGVYREAAIQTAAPFGFNDDDFVVEVSVDQNGRMTDYSIAEGQCLIDNVTLRRSIENTLLFTEFTPATSFGQRTSSKVFVSFTRSHIDVGS